MNSTTLGAVMEKEENERAHNEIEQQVTADLVSDWKEPSTRGDIRNFAVRMDLQFGKLERRFDKIDGRFDKVDAKFESIDARFDKVDAKVESIDARFDKVDAKFESIDARFDKVDAKFESIDARFDKVDAKFESIDARFDKVDAKFDTFKSEIITLINTSGLRYVGAMITANIAMFAIFEKFFAS
jgi:chromosome segregation ATPase